VSAVRLSEHVHLIPGGVNSLLVVDGDRALVIDSGQGREGGKRVKRALEALGATPVALLTSHAHADHYGGHATLLRSARVPVFAPPIEAQIMAAPLLEPIYLANGTRPGAELRSPWLLAEAVAVDDLLREGSFHFEGFDLQVLAVDGHAHHQVAFVVDDVLIAADAVFGGAVLDKYPIPFAVDAALQSAAARRVAAVDARLAVPGHGDPAPPALLAAATLQALERVEATVLSAADGADLDTVMERVTVALSIGDLDLARHHLQRTAVAAHLQAHVEGGRLTRSITRGRLRYHAA
jgi:glyoxylase-like metal-dependent hydrolase (beta-lactamase superfamily II)